MEKNLPKNICQVGNVNSSQKIFLEDYVISFLRELLQKDRTNPLVMVFFGTGFEKQGTKYYLIKGLAVMDQKKEWDGFLLERPEEPDRLDKKMRKYFLKTAKDFFPGELPVGWCYLGEESVEIPDILSRMKEQNFGKVTGYYIFYERNAAMEKYLLWWHRNQQKIMPAVTDENRRKNRRENKRENKRMPLPVEKKHRNKKAFFPVITVQILNAVSLIILIICSIIALTTINQYDKMKQLETAVIYLEEAIQEQKNLPEY